MKTLPMMRSKNVTKSLITIAAMLVLFSATAEAERLANPSDRAMAVAACVRKATKGPLRYLSPLKSVKETTESDRNRIKRELQRVSEEQTKGVNKCITEEQAYQLGWFEYLEVVAIDKCGLHRSDVLKSYRDEDDADTDLLNGAARWDQGAGPIDRRPFFRGQADARSAYRSTPLVSMCDDLRKGYGPKGDKFPGLIR